MPPGGNGKVWLVFTGISAPVLEFTADAQLPSSSRLKNPPGQRPSFWLSRLIVRSPRPPYCQARLVPPLTTLADLGDVQVDGDAFGGPFIAQSAPVAGQSRARPNVASVWILR